VASGPSAGCTLLNGASYDGRYEFQQVNFISVNPGESFTFTSADPVNGANGSLVYHAGSTTGTDKFSLPGTFTYTVPSGESFVTFIWNATKNNVRITGATANWTVSCTPAT